MVLKLDWRAERHEQPTCWIGSGSTLFSCSTPASTAAFEERQKTRFQWSASFFDLWSDSSPNVIKARTRPRSRLTAFEKCSKKCPNLRGRWNFQVCDPNFCSSCLTQWRLGTQRPVRVLQSEAGIHQEARGIWEGAPSGQIHEVWERRHYNVTARSYRDRQNLSFQCLWDSTGLLIVKRI